MNEVKQHRRRQRPTCDRTWATPSLTICLLLYLTRLAHTLTPHTPPSRMEVRLVLNSACCVCSPLCSVGLWTHTFTNHNLSDVCGVINESIRRLLLVIVALRHCRVWRSSASVFLSGNRLFHLTLNNSEILNYLWMEHQMCAMWDVRVVHVSQWNHLRHQQMNHGRHPAHLWHHCQDCVLITVNYCHRQKHKSLCSVHVSADRCEEECVCVSALW